jgi:diaminopimelate epimerase
VLHSSATRIRYDDLFKPSGLNVNFLIVKGDGHIDVVTYEKGIEKIMLSCGSGSVAAAFYASQNSNMQSPLRISNPGGEMHLTFNEDWTDLWLSSHPMILFSSTIDLDLIDLG